MITGKKRMKLKVSKNIEGLVPYPPGKPIEELERELGITGSIKLASNENPLGPSPAAVAAISRALGGLNRYPDGSCYYFKQRLSEKLGVDPEMIVVGNGSNEIIELLVRAFITPGDEAVMADPSFAVYPIAVKCAGGEARTVPLTADFRHDLAAMAKAVTGRTRLVFIANPNNPTGTIVSASEFGAFLGEIPEDVVVCVDEAYFEFVRDPSYPDALGRVREGTRPVIVLRTFSKTYGLAGLRVGYGVAQGELAGCLEKVRQPFNVNTLAQVAALACLDDDDHLKRTLENNVRGLEFLYEGAGRLGLECVPTETNFLLMKVGDGAGVYDALLKKGVIVRPMASYGMDEYIRVTVGLPEENERFMKALEEVLR